MLGTEDEDYEVQSKKSAQRGENNPFFHWGSDKIGQNISKVSNV